MKRNVRQTLKGVSLAVFAAVVAAWLFCTMPATGWQALVVPTGSMRPGMPPGSLALIHQVPASSLRIGDVITYVSPLNARETITHRIVRTFSIGGKVPGFVTKGDANAVTDPAIAAGNVRGEVVWHVPYLGTAVLGARTWVGLTLLVYIPALLINIQEFRRLRLYYKQSVPYRLALYKHRWERQPAPHMRLKLASVAAVLAAGVTGAAWSPVVWAQLHAGPVVLANNQLLLAAPAGPASCSSTNTVHASSNTNQTAVSGDASGPGASSGTATNSSTSDESVTVTNGC